jgi:hypothetical protein
MFFGQHSIGWLSYYDFAGRIGIKYDAKDIETLDCWMRLANSACWWQPRNGVALMCNRAAELNLDGQGRMHNDAGPAMRFRDGYSVWSIGGVLIDEQVVMKGDSQTVDQIRKEQNEEVKRIRIERFAGLSTPSQMGWRRYLAAVEAKPIDRRENDIDGTNEALFRTPDNMVIFLGACRSTGRIYALEQPQEIRTCEQAQNWMRSGSWLDRMKMKRRTIDAA